MGQQTAFTRRLNRLAVWSGWLPAQASKHQTNRRPQTHVPRKLPINNQNQTLTANSRRAQCVQISRHDAFIRLLWNTLQFKKWGQEMMDDHFSFGRLALPLWHTRQNTPFFSPGVVQKTSCESSQFLMLKRAKPIAFYLLLNLTFKFPSSLEGRTTM